MRDLLSFLFWLFVCILVFTKVEFSDVTSKVEEFFGATADSTEIVIEEIEEN